MVYQKLKKSYEFKMDLIGFLSQLKWRFRMAGIMPIVPPALAPRPAARSPRQSFHTPRPPAMAACPSSQAGNPVLRFGLEGTCQTRSTT